ncbi:MAG: O-antigen ligase family protein [Lachnospiraceae bacterium]|nr:O-antigen ligase family protein [Lachnospiraceae bacterium]
MGKNKAVAKSDKYDKAKLGTDIINVINYIFLFAFLTIYPLVFRIKGQSVSEKYYFNITRTRYEFFIYLSIGYILLIIVAYIFEGVWTYYNKRKSIMSTKDDYIVTPERFMWIFILANFLAYLMAVLDDGLISSDVAFYGTDARYMGFLSYFIMGFSFVMLSRYADVKLPIFSAFGATTFFSYLVAICQHIDFDLSRFKNESYKPTGIKALFEIFPRYLFRLRNGIKKAQYNVFISTFGNINIFASFVVISLAVFICMYVFTDKLFYRIMSGVIITMGGIVIMIANSDSAYIGMCAVCFFLFLLAYRQGLLLRFVQGIILMSIGNLCVVLLNKYISEVMGKSYDKRGGFAQALDRLGLALILVVLIVLIYIFMRLVNHFFVEKLEGINKNKVITCILAASAALLITIIIIGHTRHIPAFTFNYKWGTFRGYIWTKSYELFCDAPLMNKLFGYGNGSVKTLMNTYYYDEMVAVTNKVYDNAHNELLQYLLTTGLLGMFSYIGLCVTSFVYILKNSHGRVIAYMCLSAILGYFVQGLININQPITTPFMFLFMALGVGYVRYLKVEER